MKPTSPEQLARLLDQLSASYPNGIPLSVIKGPDDHTAVDHAPDKHAPENQEVSTAPAYHILIAGDEESLSHVARELLVGITSKGLKISDDEYAVTYGSPSELADNAAGSLSPHVVVFGAEGESGWGERADGREILFTHPLEMLVSDATLKKELWRQLQAILARM